MNRLGIDLGGTKIEGAVIDDTGDILKRERLPTPRDDYEGTLAAIAEVADMLVPDRSVPAGIGTPGSISKVSGLMRNANSTCLNGNPLAKDLAKVMQREVRLANDADCFALSEAVGGAAAGADLVFGVILGTGVGGGICANGRLVSGVNGITGEWGHNTLPMQSAPTNVPRADRECFCGRLNCVETWCSGPALARSFVEQTGSELGTDEIAARAAKGDEQCQAVLGDYLELLSLALSGVINLLDPDVIVLGGGLSNVPQLYDELPKRLPKYVFSDHVDTQIVRAQHGDSSGVRGAAWLWPEE